MNRLRFIKVQTRFEATHCYPDAPKAVSHLRNEHRHTFVVKVQIEVKHSNRDLEFYMVKDYLDRVVKKKNMNSASCEKINDKFYKSIEKKYGKRKVVIETSEDLMRSAITYYNWKEDECESIYYSTR